jgi:Ca2+-binding RTX toxin-like protein
VLTGGFGKDYLTGGAGNDTFRFNLVAESPAGSNRDVVVDFASGTDKIDLSGIDAIAAGGGVNDAFAYVGAGNFTNVAGQLRFDTSTGTLQGDTNGDGTADFEVQLVGVNTPLPGTDFIL